jgi:hypothetical protein
LGFFVFSHTFFGICVGAETSKLSIHRDGRKDQPARVSLAGLEYSHPLVFGLAKEAAVGQISSRGGLVFVSCLRKEMLTPYKGGFAVLCVQRHLFVEELRGAPATIPQHDDGSTRSIPKMVRGSSMTQSDAV